jgi:hypothetical protein
MTDIRRATENTRNLNQKGKTTWQGKDDIAVNWRWGAGNRSFDPESEN